MTIRLTDEVLRGVVDLLYRRTGMLFGPNKRYYIERRVVARMEALGVEDARAYLALAAQDAEAEQLVNAFTVNETYFYREEHQFRALAEEILPAVTQGKRPGDLLRIWSLPCSTGEEPYSIAIWLLEHWPLVDVYHVEIVGSDIDTAVLAAARAGRYGTRALARLPAEVREAYFEPEHRHTRQIIGDLRDSVTFTQANLADGDSVAAQGRFDVILCRNLLIYFDEASRTHAARHLYHALKPGGFLCLGHSESMARMSDAFTTVRLRDAIVYRRP